MRGRGLTGQPGTNIFNRTAVETRRYELVETPLQDILLQLGQHEHTFARHDLDPKLLFELRPTEHVARVLARKIGREDCRYGDDSISV